MPCDDTEEINEIAIEKPPTNVPMIEQVDEIMDHSIEIASNKRMRSANISVWSMKFKDPDLEKKVRSCIALCHLQCIGEIIRLRFLLFQFGQTKEDMFKSNMLCCFVIWVFIVILQFIIIKEW